MAKRRYYTTEEAGEMLGVQPQTVRRYIRQGRIKAEQQGWGRGEYEIDSRSLKAFAKKPRQRGGNRRNPRLSTYLKPPC